MKKELRYLILIYRKNIRLFDQQPLLVYGRVMNDEGAISVEVQKIEVLGRENVGQAAGVFASDALRFAG